MATDLHPGAAPKTQPTWTSKRLNTARAMYHGKRPPFAAIRLSAGVEGAGGRQRLDGTPEKTLWLNDMVEGVIGDAADDRPARVDVVEVTASCVSQAKATTRCDIQLDGVDHAVAVASPVALRWAIGCVLYHAMRAAGSGGHVTVAVTGTDSEITIQVIDDGPQLGNEPTHSAFGLTVTRALVSACGGAFELQLDPACSVVARIVLPAAAPEPIPS